MSSARFHLAFPVHDLDEARAFYGGVLGCPEGRSSATWVDFDLAGHQVVAHLAPDDCRPPSTNAVDGHDVPASHFGLLMGPADWDQLVERLRATADTRWVMEPTVRFAGDPGEQRTCFILDPSGNALEFKSFADDSQVFAQSAQPAAQSAQAARQVVQAAQPAQPADRRPGPLSGIKVVDFTRVLAGPLATMNLADLGAEVIKIEQPGVGDDTRAWGPPWVGDDSTYYLGINRNKKSVVLDLNSEADVALAAELCATADVVAENFRPGFMAERGLGHDALSALNPTLIYLSIEAFSGDGPTSTLPGYDLMIQAMSGLMHITGAADGPPMKVGVALVDVVTGLYATIAALAGLQQRAKTGRGCYMEVSLFDSALAALANQSAAAVMAGVDPIRNGNRHPSIAPYEVFEVSDGTIVVAAGNDKTYRLLCGVIGLPELVDDPRFVDVESRRANVDDLVAAIGAVLATDTREAWLKRLLDVGVPAGPINSIAEAIEWAESMGLAPTVSGGDGQFRSVRSPIRIDGLVQSTCAPPPKLDQHGDEIRAARPVGSAPGVAGEGSGR